jgi:hypothetical protein
LREAGRTIWVEKFWQTLRGAIMDTYVVTYDLREGINHEKLEHTINSFSGAERQQGSTWLFYATGDVSHIITVLQGGIDNGDDVLLVDLKNQHLHKITNKQHLQIV